LLLGGRYRAVAAGVARGFPEEIYPHRQKLTPNQLDNLKIRKSTP